MSRRYSAFDPDVIWLEIRTFGSANRRKSAVRRRSLPVRRRSPSRPAARSPN
jgi:hypothetical protein